MLYFIYFLKTYRHLHTFHHGRLLHWRVGWKTGKKAAWWDRFSNLRDVCLNGGDTHTEAVQVVVPFMCRHSGWHAKHVLSMIASRGSLQQHRKKQNPRAEWPRPLFKRLHVKWRSPLQLNCKALRTQYFAGLCQDKQMWVNVPVQLQCLSQIFQRFSSKTLEYIWS